MAYSYCVKCNTEMNSPEIRESLQGFHNCKYCGERNDLSEYDRNQAFSDLVNRLEELENFVEKFKISNSKREF